MKVETIYASPDREGRPGHPTDVQVWPSGRIVIGTGGFDRAGFEPDEVPALLAALSKRFGEAPARPLVDGSTMGDACGRDAPDEIPAVAPPAHVSTRTEIDSLLEFDDVEDAPPAPSRLKRRSVFELDNFRIDGATPGIINLRRRDGVGGLCVPVGLAPDLIEALAQLHAEHVARADS